MTAYSEFLNVKQQLRTKDGFKPIWIPNFLFDFQAHLTEWAIEQGRAALYEDCGMGKCPQALVWAENVVRHTNKPVLFLAPLGVAPQTVREAEKFGIEAKRSRDGSVFPNITVTNYEKLHMFNPWEFSGVVCDESSCIKNMAGTRRKDITEFMKKCRYRLLCTATAAPNDYVEFGTSSEALGYLGNQDMLTTFFRTQQDSFHPVWQQAKWLFKPHSQEHFWKWICSWARAIRKPSDLGFSDGRFVLPPVQMNEIVVERKAPPQDALFVMPAITMAEQREERKATLNERCEEVARLLDHPNAAVAWAHTNDEGDLLERLIEGSVQVAGSDSDEFKEETFLAFSTGEIKKLVTKPRLGAFGLNWQHCAHQTWFPSHSFEQFYQGVRRSLRFGQDQEVRIDIVTTDGEQRVLHNLKRKSDATDKMFTELVAHMNDAMGVHAKGDYNKPVDIPSWI